MKWYDILGTLGVAVIILTYAMLQLGRIRSEQVLYSILNAVGASLILVSLYFDFNFPSVVVEAFWLMISIFGIAKYFIRRNSSWVRRPGFTRICSGTASLPMSCSNAAVRIAT